MANTKPLEKNEVNNNNSFNNTAEHNNSSTCNSNNSIPDSKSGNRNNDIDDIFKDSLSYAYTGLGLRAARTSRKLSQAQVSNYLNISLSSYSIFECGHRMPDIIILLKLCSYYKINISYFIFLLCMDCIGKSGFDANTIFEIFSYNQLFDRDENYVISTFRKLPASYKDDVISFLKSAKKCEEWEPPVML